MRKNGITWVSGAPHRSDKKQVAKRFTMTICKFEKNTFKYEFLNYEHNFTPVWTWESWDPPGEGTFEIYFSNMGENLYVFDHFSLPAPIEEAHRTNREEKTSGSLKRIQKISSPNIFLNLDFSHQYSDFSLHYGTQLEVVQVRDNKNLSKKEIFFWNSFSRMAIISPSRQSSLRTWSRPAEHPKVTWLWSWRKWRKLRHPVSTKKYRFSFFVGKHFFALTKTAIHRVLWHFSWQPSGWDCAAEEDISSSSKIKNWSP